MHATPHYFTKSISAHLMTFSWLVLGAFLAAFSIEVFFIPNNLIDGGIVGVSMILGTLFGHGWIPIFLLIINIPFLFIAFRSIGKGFVIHFLLAVLLFAGSMVFITNVTSWEFIGDSLEVVVIGGAILGIGLGIIIRMGGCLDGTEILGIIINRRTGFSVGQVVLFCNVFVFGAAGVVFQDWHPPLLSLITYLVAVKVMDSVIVGLEETKSVIIMSSKSKAIAEAIVHELGLGLTVMYGRGGYSGKDQEILYVIAERLQLAELKEIIYQEDPSAFIAIENLHEVVNGRQLEGSLGAKATMRKILSTLFTKKPKKKRKKRGSSHA